MGNRCDDTRVDIIVTAAVSSISDTAQNSLDSVQGVARVNWIGRFLSKSFFFLP